MTKKSCTQTKCCFLGTASCPRCSECGCPPNFVEHDTCVNCWNCLSDEGYVRNGTPDVPGVAEAEKLEVMEVTK
jgi:hypothetical protein